MAFVPIYCAYSSNCLLFNHKLGVTLAHEAFLGCRLDQPSVAGEKCPPAEPPAAARRRAVLDIKHPVVHPRRTMEPHRMVETGKLDVRVEKQLPMRDQRV